MVILWVLYVGEGMKEEAMKYASIAARNDDPILIECLVHELASENSTDRNAEEASEWLNRRSNPYLRSFLLFQRHCSSKEQEKSAKGVGYRLQRPRIIGRWYGIGWAAGFWKWPLLFVLIAFGSTI